MPTCVNRVSATGSYSCASKPSLWLNSSAVAIDVTHLMEKTHMRQRPHRETEKSFMAAVVDRAPLGHWRVFHPYLSIRSAPAIQIYS